MVYLSGPDAYALFEGVCNDITIYDACFSFPARFSRRFWTDLLLTKIYS